MPERQSELRVITAAKNLCGYVMTVTQKSPKQFRFSLVGRMQGLVPEIVEERYYAHPCGAGKPFGMGKPTGAPEKGEDRAEAAVLCRTCQQEALRPKKQ